MAEEQVKQKAVELEAAIVASEEVKSKSKFEDIDELEATAGSVSTKYRANAQGPQLLSSDNSPGLPGSDLTLLSVKTFLKEGDFPADKAEDLGEYLGINPGRISTLKKENNGYLDRLLSSVIKEWLNNDSEKSWQKLATALKHCDHKLMAEKIAPQKDDGSFPSQLVSDMPLAIHGMPQKLDTFEHSDKLLSVKENILKLENSFHELAYRLLGELREKNIHVNNIVDCLTVTQWSKNKEVYNLVHEKMDEMENEKTLRRLINLLNTVWNFLDYHLLEYIIIKFGSKSLKENMRQYVSDFENFQQNTTLYHFTQCWPGRQKKPPEYVKVTAELRLDPKTCTLHKLDELRRTIQREFFPSLSKYISTLLDDKHEMGSFVITWILPPQLADQLIRGAIRPENHHFFKENNILSFSVRNQLLYNEKRLHVQAKMMASPLKELSYGSVEIYTDETLGIGSYGKVCKAKCGQLPCAAKLLHDTMFQDNDPGINRFLERFEQECHFLSTIKHPNIVQFLRTARNPGTGRPVLLMELMDESLTRFLERSTCTIPYHTQLNICHNVALALSYLHSNSIIHRDLSSNNILLVGAGSRAKVTDFGMSKLTDMNPRMTPLTLCPGTTVYMPPEALTSPPHYSNKLDCFSYGVLTVQIVTQNFPNPTDATYIVRDSRYPTGQVAVFIPEVDRRKKDIDLIDPDHPLRPVALYCLKDIETERPSSDDLCERLASLKRERKYTHSEEQSRNQTASVQRLELELQRKTEEYQNAVNVKERYQKIERYLEQSQVQYQEAVDAKEQYRSELEQSQLQYHETVKQLKESRAREQQLRKELNDMRGQEVLICKERNEASKSPLKAGVSHKKKSRNVPAQDVQKEQKQTKQVSLKLTWRQGKSAPENMISFNGAAVVHGNIVYFSAGYNVYSFELPDKWTKFKQCPHKFFGLVVINEQLTAIGGENKSWNITNILLSLKHGQSGSEWEQFLQPMPTARVRPVTVTTPTHLVVVGGKTSTFLFGYSLSTVEVMDIETLQWSTASGLPHVICFPKMTLCDEHLYLSDDNNTLFSCSMEGLLQSSKEPVSTDNSKGGSVWIRLANIPVRKTSSLVTFGGRVLAITSKYCNGKLTGAIHCYNKATNSWSIIGEMPTPRYDVLTAVLPTNKLVVVGGYIAIFNDCTDTEIGEVVPE